MTEPEAGTLADGVHRLPVRVYYEDTDFSGVVYHASYFRFCERGRTEFLRAVGVHHSVLHAAEAADRRAFVVRHLEADFLKGAQIDDTLSVETRVAALKGASLTMGQVILRDGVPLFRLSVKVALIDAAGRPARFPADLTERFSAAGIAAAGPV